MLSYSQFAFVAALISTVLAIIAYAWAMSAGHRADVAGAAKRRCSSRHTGDDLLDDLDTSVGWSRGTPWPVTPPSRRRRWPGTARA